jgi:DNA polymerase-3 subunit alpha
MAKPFVHLHNHTEYSLLDGATRVKDMVKTAKKHDMPAIAITDHGVMFGCMEFYFEAKKEGIKPILGMEAYVAPRGMDKKDGRADNELFHLLLLARNVEGYRNLCKLHTLAALDGFYYKPRLDHNALRQYTKGLISSTTCLGSEVNQYLLVGDYEKAQYTAGMYKEMFDEGCYFVELQDHNLPEQKLVNEGLVKIATDLKIPMVVTNDAHYLCRADSDPHDVLLCIGTGALVTDEKRLKFSGSEFYIKSPDEMASLFPHLPEAYENSLMIAEKCEAYELGSSRAIMPEPEMEAGHNPSSYLRYLAEKGLRDRVRSVDEAAIERLEYELSVIERTDYSAYFLLVREFANFTRSKGIMFGVRGSAAGSLVSYTLGITDVSPLEYDLTFERFLNPERVSMPDIDMDFEDARRDEVIKWVGERYGQDRVAQIITFGTMGAKAAIRDAARVMGFSPQEADRVAKTIPTGPGWSIDKAEKELAEFKEAIRDPRIQTLVETAKRIEGLARNQGVHAAGVVISAEPLSNYIPLHRSADGLPVTAYEMGILEKIGLLKMDFLGLSNLTVLARTIENVKQMLGEVDEKLISDHPVLQGHTNIPFDDDSTYNMLGRGDTVGVFQLESGGMRRNIVELKPRSVTELAAMVALYRPGPMDHIPRFVSNKFGRTKIEYLDERMAPILEETYGIIVYQDQVMKLVQALAGFTLGKADIMRKAMGKKDAAVMAGMKVEFVDGCSANGITEQVSNIIWELLLPFAGYAFNKAHAYCYAILAYQTAYLKAKYPVEYMAALLAVYRGKEDRVTAFIEECRRQKIAILPPDVNRSQADFTIEHIKSGQAIRFGLGAIKGVGEALIEAIVRGRAEKPFTHLYEFAERLKPFGLNKSALEALVRAGAFEAVERNRAQLLDLVPAAMVFADNELRRKQSGQDSLFGEPGQVQQAVYPVLPGGFPSASRSEILTMEKETMGIYISDHPLRGYERVLAKDRTHTCEQIGELEDSIPVVATGVLAQCEKKIAKSGTRVCRFVLEDFSGQIAGFAFGDTIGKYENALSKDRVVRLRGRLKFDERSMSTERRAELQVFEAVELEAPIDLGVDDESIAGTVFISLEKATRKELAALREIIAGNPGDYGVYISFPGVRGVEAILPLERIDASPQVLSALRRAVTSAEVIAESRQRPPLHLAEDAPAVSAMTL